MTHLLHDFTLVTDPSGEQVLEVPFGGALLEELPLYNKGTAFTDAERDQLGLRGLLPPRVFSMEEQVARVMDNYARKSSDLERYIHLMALLDRNETLFYRVVLEHLDELLPNIYTPTEGHACQRFGQIYRRSRGIYLTPEDAPRVRQILEGWPSDDVRIIVVTDGERILGLGDLGAGGMGIPIGKLALYVVAAGFHPSQALPICLDVGTDNEALRQDPLYLGQPRPRVRGAAYDALVESLFAAVAEVYPRALVQFEDFGIKNSFRLLDRFKDRFCTFNDDIQGTGAVATAAILSAMRLTGGELAAQRIVIAGAGSAGVGIARQLRAASAEAQIWLANSGGIVTPEDATEFQRPFAHADGGPLLDVCRRIQPTVLIGVTGKAGLFSRELVATMDAKRPPIVLPLSNPTASSECTPAEVRAWTAGRCMVATGSPFADTDQCNNVYVFPGVGLGVSLSGAARVTDAMFTAAAKAVSALGGERLLPPLSDIRKVSAAVARAVGAQAPEVGMWQPRYVPYRLKAALASR